MHSDGITHNVQTISRTGRTDYLEMGKHQPLNAVRDEARERQRGVIRSILATHPGLTITDVARSCGLSPSTLTRFMNDPAATNVLNGSTMALIEKSYGISDGPAGGFAEPDVELVVETRGQGEAFGPNRHRWRVGRNFAALSGYRPGDILTIDMSIPPAEGDDVIAQIEDMKGGAITVLRRLRRGWLIGGSDEIPEFIDGMRVRVAGVVIESVRRRDG